MTQLQLTGRMLAIARGETSLAPEQVRAYRELWTRQGYELPRLERPGILRRALNFARAIGRHARDRFRKCSRAQIAGRLAICQACEHFTGSACAQCGCPAGSSQGFLNKLAWKSEACPIGRWPRLDRSPDPAPPPTATPPAAAAAAPQRGEVLANEAPQLHDGGFRAGDYRSPLAVYNRDGRPVALHDTYRGAALFLLCSGPSLETVNRELLARRGVVTMGLNNSPAIVRPHLWTYVDAPTRWIEQIWNDAAVLKFIPQAHHTQRFRVRDARDRLKDSAQTIGELPAVFSYLRNADFNPDRWLTEPSFNWGCADELRCADGATGTRTVFLVALKLAYWLGFRTVYLLGCDWRMDPAKPYAFAQAADAGKARSNNALYRITRHRLQLLKPHFDRAGFRVINCTPGSRLDVFPRTTLEDAIDQATAAVPARIQTQGMY